METLSPCDERTTTGTALQQGAMTTDDANAGEVDELWSLLAHKDADLRHAAELGKMLLDEKEADAEAHEAEKEALWRRIQEMARRVMELEQDAAEMRAVSHQSHAAAAVDDDDENEKTFPAGPIDTPGHKEWAGRGSFGSKRGSIGSGSERAEERVLRAKNEMLERQLQHMKEEAEETELELAAARKARFGRRSSCYGRRSTSRPPSSRASSSRADRFRRSISAISPPPSTSSARRRESGTFGSGTYGGGDASVDGCGGDDGGGGGGRGRGGGGGGVGVGRVYGSYSSRPGGAALGRPSVASGTSSLSRLSGWLASPRVSAEGVEEDDDEDDDVDIGDAGSETSEEALRIADRIHASGWTRGIEVEGVEDLAEEGEVVGDEGIVDEHDSAWLLEQNAWLMEELDSKDALIEALREQLQQQQQHRQSEQGGARYSYHERVGRASSDDDDDDDEEGSDCPSFEGRERSFLDNLLDGNEGQTSGQLYRRYSSADAAIDEGEGDEEEGGEGVFEATDCEAGRVKCAARRRSFGEVLTENALPGVDNSSETDAWKRAKSKSPVREGRENSLSPLRPDEAQQSPGQRRSSVELKGLSRSPIATVRRLEDGRMPGAGAGAGIETSGGGAAAAADTATVATATAAPRVVEEAALETQGASLEESLVLSSAEETAQQPAAQEVSSAAATVALEPASVEPAALLPAALESVTQESVAPALVIEASVSPAVTAPPAEVPAGSVAPAAAAVTLAAASGVLAVKSEMAVAAVVQPELAAERDAVIAADAEREEIEKAEVVAVVATVVAEVVAVAAAAAEQKVLVAAAAKRKEEEAAAAVVAAVTAKRKGEEAVAAAATQKEEEVAAAATAAAASAAAAVAVASKQEKAAAAAAATAVAAAAKRKREEAAAAAAAAAEPPAAPQNRAERKSRQAVEKLGLRTVKGVFRMTMKTSNGVVFVVKRPDVFKHPQQDTYVVFGTTETDRSGSEVRVPYSGAQTSSAAATMIEEKGADMKMLTSTSTSTSTATATAMSTLPLAAAATAAAASGAGAGGSPSRSRPDPSAVEIESVAAGVDPADTLTILSHAGCSTEVAIAALRRADGDVVDAAMSLTAV